ncbi:MAG: potassium transporter [Deltaproteobacteria bacterium]|nr:potassium transporter [Deltaproteobacteria bacterium]
MRKLEGNTVFIICYLLAILVGGFLLWLPFSNPGLNISFLDAVFTATSALCVTGLTVVDTGTAYSLVGQLIILVLIQAGGLGITTFSVWLFLSLGRDIGFKSRLFMQSTFSPRPTDELKGLLRLIFLYTFLIEFLGAFILFIYWSFRFPWSRAAYLGLFHGISAFCNAGFGLFPDNLLQYQSSFVVSLTIAALIILGGLGFPVAYELVGVYQRKKTGSRIRLSLHSHLVLLTTAVLIFGGMVFLYGIEYNDSLARLPVHQGLLVALFQSVTARTAGFNTIDLATLTNASLLVLIILMFIGASPGSCGGGIKTSTFALLGGLLWNRLRGKSQVHLFHRTVPEEAVSRAMALFALACGLVLVMSTLVLMVESGNVPFTKARGRLMEVLFEVVSAFGTVGLSINFTPTLEPASKILIILTMVLGRVGILSLGYSIARKQERHPVLYAEESVMVG